MSLSAKYLALALLWAGLIFVASATPAVGQETGLPSAFNGVLHSGAHLLLYGVLAWLIWRTVSPNLPFQREATSLSMLVICLAVAYGLTDEYHQSFTPGREMSLLDLGFDFVGAVLGLAMGKWLSK